MLSVLVQKEVQNGTKWGSQGPPFWATGWYHSTADDNDTPAKKTHLSKDHLRLPQKHGNLKTQRTPTKPFLTTATPRLLHSILGEKQLKLGLLGLTSQRLTPAFLGRQFLGALLWMLSVGKAGEGGQALIPCLSGITLTGSTPGLGGTGWEQEIVAGLAEARPHSGTLSVHMCWRNTYLWRWTPCAAPECLYMKKRFQRRLWYLSNKWDKQVKHYCFTSSLIWSWFRALRCIYNTSQHVVSRGNATFFQQSGKCVVRQSNDRNESRGFSGLLWHRGNLDTSAFKWSFQNFPWDNGGSYVIYFKAKQISLSPLTHLKAPCPGVRHYIPHCASEWGGIIYLSN